MQKLNVKDQEKISKLLSAFTKRMGKLPKISLTLENLETIYEECGLSFVPYAKIELGNFVLVKESPYEYELRTRELPIETIARELLTAKKGQIGDQATIDSKVVLSFLSDLSAPTIMELRNKGAPMLSNEVKRLISPLLELYLELLKDNFEFALDSALSKRRL